MSILGEIPVQAAGLRVRLRPLEKALDMVLKGLKPSS